MKKIDMFAAVVLGTAILMSAPSTVRAQDAPPTAPQAGPSVMPMPVNPSATMMPESVNAPYQANPIGLLQRSEVQNELRLSLKQRRAMQDAEAGLLDAARQRIEQAFQNTRFSPQEMRSMTLEQRRQKIQQARQQAETQMEDARKSVQAQLAEKIKEVLKPDQWARLNQLDLQKRGPLAMADPQVAEQAKLTQEHRAQIAQVAGEDRRQSGQVVQQAYQQLREQTRRSGVLQPGQRPPTPDFTSRLSPWRLKLDKIRKDSEDKVVNLLSDEEWAGWKAAIGTPFAFRAYSPESN